MKASAFYVGSSLLAPMKQAERAINDQYGLDLTIAAHNFGLPLNEDEWLNIEQDVRESTIVFVMHVMDAENATRLIDALEKCKQQNAAVIVINCLPDLMRRTRMGQLDISRLTGQEEGSAEAGKSKGSAVRLLSTAGSWVGRQVKRGKGENGKSHTQYLKLIDKLPGLLKFVPAAGSLRDVKHYLNLFCYFLQPTPANIQSMILYALKEYASDERLQKVEVNVPPPERKPSLAIYHPEAPELFESFEEYRNWYLGRDVNGVSPGLRDLNPDSTIGLLLMRPTVVSRTTRHYDALIRAVEAEGLSVIPALSTLMDNREAVSRFFVGDHESKAQPRISQIVSLTGFSFVGGPAMNDSEAASNFLQQLNRPYRSAVSLDTQTIDAWRSSPTGLNPVQSGMQIAIPEIDGATEPFLYGGIPASGVEPVPLGDRCEIFARRLKRWNHLQTAPRNALKVAVNLFCFPPNKGNIGTAADLDVFTSLWDMLNKLKSEGYDVEVPASAEVLRERLIGGNADAFDSNANVAYRMGLDEYRRLCPYVAEVEAEWGAAPGRVNSFGREVLIQGVQLGNVFVGVQPTFGYEGDPMRLMMARSGAPHHGFMAFYTYLTKVLEVDAVIHLGTHGALEFMPGKQVGLSGECWPDRLIGELPNIYVYSVNNPSEGSIAKRRSYAELISYLTPPIENAGLYRDLSTLKELLLSYRQSTNELERARLFESIENCAGELNFVN